MGGIAGFSDAAYAAFKESPSEYYPTPVFGPILFPTMLGNVGGFFANGFDSYLEKGMPWLFQQGISCSTFYHFYVHDVEGVIGVTLRSVVRPVAVQVMMLLGADEKEREDNALFGKVAFGIFMLAMAILRMNQFLGPSFSPFVMVGDMLTLGKKKSKAFKPAKSGGGNNGAAPSKSKKNKKKSQ